MAEKKTKKDKQTNNSPQNTEQKMYGKLRCIPSTNPFLTCTVNTFYKDYTFQGKL